LAHEGSRDNLIGAGAPAELVDRYSLELRDHRNTPPCFIVHSDDDPSVPVGNSVALEEVLSRAGVPHEFVRHPTGGHGYGMGPDHGFQTAPDWTPRLYLWLRARGLAS
jgi:dipeptidyl aminopeptidase/acylaminoacyl peptidase